MSNFLINNKAIIKDKVDMLQSLSDIEIATKILEDSKDDGENVLEMHYKKLSCDIRHIKRDDVIYTTLEEYLYNSSSDYYQKIELIEAYELNKNSHFKDHGNKKLLWHGSRITNFVGILSQGLRIAPPEAPKSGYLFGKGVYFADMASKSACYCHPSNNIALIMLCEVALGNHNELLTTDYNAENLPAVKHSTKGCGKTIPSHEIELDGVKVPLGKPVSSSYKVSFLYFIFK